MISEEKRSLYSLFRGLVFTFFEPQNLRNLSKNVPNGASPEADTINSKNQ